MTGGSDGRLTIAAAVSTLASLDIYTGRPIAVDSEEHILPNFLGGRLRIGGLIDKATNDALGATIDAALADALHMFRVHLDVRSHRGDRPVPPMKGVAGPGGAKYRLDPGGLVSAAPNLKIEERQGRLHLSGTCPDMPTLEGLLRKYAKRKRLDADRIIEQARALVRNKREAPPTLTFDLELYKPDCYRAIAKVACNLLARHDKPLFLRSAFDPVRRFVIEGTWSGPMPVQAVEVDLREGGLGTLDHLVSVRSDDQGQMLGLVVLFGLLGFVVNLGTLSGEAGVTRSYRVNQVAVEEDGAHDRLDDPGDLAILMPDFARAAQRTPADFQALAVRALEALLTDVLAMQRRAHLQKIIDPILDRAFASATSTDGELSSAEHSALANELAAAVVEDVRPLIESAAEARVAEAQAALDAMLKPPKPSDDE